MTEGILRVDKPAGLTSHDVVARVRRALGTREVGHAGTLDPMATGLLVMLVGEATKLSAYVTAADKRYDATVRFGTSTDSLDADGAPTETRAITPPTRDAIAHVLASMVGPIAQVPPAVSAIKQGGVASHERARRGETVELPPRDVVLHAVELIGADGDACSFRLHVSKGFYVRSLARDLAAALGVPGHLAALRRTHSGAFDLDGALDAHILADAARTRDAASCDRVRAHLEPLVTATRAIPRLDVTDEEAVALLCGRLVDVPASPDGAVLVFAPRDPSRPVCIGAIASGVLRNARGFPPVV